jgi:hypothetical protein
MFEKSKIRKEFERLAEDNEIPMATIVNTQMSLRTIGGGNSVGDVESRNTAEQFVWTSESASLGWCLGGRAFEMLQQLLSRPKEIEDCKDGFLDAADGYFSQLRDELDEIDPGIKKPSNDGSSDDDKDTDEN